MRIRLVGLVSLLIAAVSGSAFAADMPVKAARMVPTEFSWTGFYAGVGTGYHDGKITQEGCVGLCAVDPTLKGFGLSVQAGYDYQFANRFVLGAFGRIPVFGPRQTINLGAPGLDFHITPIFTAELAGRIGYAYGQWLPYVFGGAAFAVVEGHSDVTGLTPCNTHVGPIVGGGIEYAFMPHLSVDFHYTYASLPKKVYDFGGGVESYGEDSSNYTVAFNYRF